MANNKIVLKFLADTRQINKATAEINQKMTNLSKVTKAAGIATAAYFTAKPIVDFAKQSILAASDLEESIAKVNTVFGSNSSIIRDWAQDAVTNLGATEQQALEAAGTFGNLFTAFGVGNDKATEMSITLVQLATDLASFNNTSVEQAITALRSGLSGETEPLKRYGVALNQASIEAEALALGVYDGKGAIDAAAKSMGIYELVMRQTKVAQGDFERTGDGLANQMKKLEAQVEETKTAFGEGFLDALRDSETTLDDTRNSVALLDGALEALGRGAGDAVSSFASLIPELETVKKGTEEYEEQNWLAKASADALAVATSYLAQYSFSPLSVSVRIATNSVGALNRQLQNALRNIDDLTNNQFDLYQPGGSGSSAGEAVARLTEGTMEWSAATAYNNYNMTEAILTQREWGRQNKKTEEGLSRSGSSAQKAAKEFVKVKDILKGIASESTFAIQGIKSVTGKVGTGVNDAIQAQLEATSELINQQIEIIEQGEAEIARISSGIVNSVLGNLGFQTQDAEGNALTGEQIAQLFIGDTKKQKEAVEAIAKGIGTNLPPELLNQVLSLPADSAIALADYLGANPEMLKKLKDNYSDLATYTEIELGIPMGESFAKIGDESAVSMMKSAREAIKKEADSFKKFVKRKLDTDVTINVRYNYINPPGQTTAGATSAVRNIQNYERLNGRSWRS